MQVFGSERCFSTEFISLHSQFSFSGPEDSLVVSNQQREIVNAIVIENNTGSFAHNKF